MNLNWHNIVAAGAALAIVFQSGMAAGGESAGEENSPGGSDDSTWSYGAEIYLWGASVGGTSASGTDIDIDFDSLLDNLHLGMMGAVAAEKGKWAIIADVFYVDIRGDGKFTTEVSGNPITAKVDVGSKLFFATIGCEYRFVETDMTHLSARLGVRHASLDNKLELRVANVIDEKISDSEQGWNAIAGFRGMTNLGQKWYLTYYADVGTGDAEFTWQVLAGIHYRFKHVDFGLGYRYLEYNFDDNTVYDDLDLNGPIAGIKYRF